MVTSRKQCLLDYMMSAIEDGMYLTLVIYNPEMPRTEKIVNPAQNLGFKMAYIERAYNDDLELINNPAIKIVDWE